MSYVDQNLIPGETVAHRGHLHWIVYLKSIVLVVLGIASVSAAAILARKEPALAKVEYFGFIAIALGLLVAIPTLIASMTTELVVTSKRVVSKHGLIRRETFEMLHKKVESISVHQSIPGRVLGYGTLVIHGTGGGREVIPTVAAPLAFRNAAMAQSDAA